jgi:hypothetical protein
LTGSAYLSRTAGGPESSPRRLPISTGRRPPLSPLATMLGESSSNGCSLRTPDGSNRRRADVTERGLGRLNWADSGRKRKVRFGREIGPRRTGKVALDQLMAAIPQRRWPPTPHRRPTGPRQASRSVLASCRSGRSNPSLNQPCVSPSTRLASGILPCFIQSRPRLVAARSSSDFAP